MRKARVICLVRHFDGVPKLSDFRIEEQTLPALKQNQALVEAVSISVDPYLRVFSETIQGGDVMIGTQVAKVVESKSTRLPVGKFLVVNKGWRTHTIVDDHSLDGATSGSTAADLGDAWLMEDIGDLPKSLGVGALGMPGVTALFGFLRMCKPEAGETVVVNAAGGAVGSLVGQIAKIKGCRVIGFAGTDAKCKWIKDDLGFDFAFNYRKTDIKQSLSQAAPGGVDCFFDNVGGLFTCAVIEHMNPCGRISICGNIANYNSPGPVHGPLPFWHILAKQLSVKGFDISRWKKDWPEGIQQMKRYIEQGQLKYRETITEGFENTPEAFISLFNGENVGKAVVRMSTFQ